MEEERLIKVIEGWKKITKRSLTDYAYEERYKYYDRLIAILRRDIEWRKR